MPRKPPPSATRSTRVQMELVLQVGKLKSVLAAHLHSLDPEEDEELAAVLARPRHETMRCELRDLDAGLMLRLQVS